MAAGDITEPHPDILELEVLTAAVATNGVPTLSTAGVSLAGHWRR